MADIQLLTDGKEQLQTACQQIREIFGGDDQFSSYNSYINEDTLKFFCKVGEQNYIEFHARTTSNKYLRKNVGLRAELVHMKSKNRQSCEVVKQQNGAHKISYQPANRGEHALHITVEGKPVQSNPCLINVVPSSQSLNRPIRIMGSFNRPRGTAINSKGQIVVAKYSVHCVSIFTPEGEEVKTFGTQGSGNGELSSPWGVTVDRDDNIYVTEHGNYRVQKFTSEGKFVATVGSHGSKLLEFNWPIGICFHKQTNSLYVCDHGNHRIQVLSTDLKFKNSFGNKGSGDGHFQNPCGIAIDNANNLYVADCYNHRVQVFTAEGQFLRAFTKKANGETLKSPSNIAVDSSNTVYVSEHGLCVSVFTSQGDYITSFGKKGTEQGQFYTIHGLTVDRNDSIIVSDWNNSRLQIF